MGRPMGLLELVLAVPGALVTVVAFVLWWRARRGGPPAEPIPWLPVALGALGVLASPAIGLVLAPVLFLALPHPSGAVVMGGATDVARAAGALVGPGCLWAATPGLAFAGWLLLSRERRLWPAATFAGVSWLGLTVGMLLAVRISIEMPHHLVPDGVAPTMLLLGVVQMRANAMVGLGVAGACLGVSVVAGVSSAGFRVALWATALMPLWALTIGALTTPPDVLSQILMALPMVACWLLALALGAAVERVRHG